jgi:hypothetical protein
MIRVMNESSASHPRLGDGKAAVLICACLLVLFGTVAWLASLKKVATADEPLHLVSAYLAACDGDFRCNLEDPPLWKYVAVAGSNCAALKLDLHSWRWPKLLQTLNVEGDFVQDSLYHTPGNDADALVRAGRARLLAIGILLGGLIGWWAWRLGGAIAATVATAAFALDPNFLVHTPLVKNDVFFALTALLTAYCLWIAGKRLSVLSGLALCAAVGIGLTVKFTGILLVPIVIICLVIRALSPLPWLALGRPLNSRMSRMAAAGVMAVIGILVCGTAIWGCYRFRWGPSPVQGQTLDFSQVLVVASQEESILAHRDVRLPTREQIDQWVTQWRPGWFVRLGRFLHDHRLLPQAWVAGMVYSYAGSLQRKTFLCGQYSRFGWWYYFPAAMLFKTPLATLAAVLLAGAIGIGGARRWMTAPGSIHALLASRQSWAASCLMIPPASLLGAAMSSHIDLGLRHVLAIYPFIYIGMGLAAAYAWRRRRTATIVWSTLLGLGLAIETFAAFPNYIPFFNAAVGGWRGGARLLSDSNIDWGQDLGLLRDWQRQHPDVQLHLCYWGAADPRYYGINYVRMPGGSGPDDEKPDPRRRPIVAISVNSIQGTGWYPTANDLYAGYRHRAPLDVLGGSIYLFDPLAAP